jgi:hypothetical protein
MTRTATICLCSLLLLLSFVLYRQTRATNRTVSAIVGADSETEDSSIVLPAVSSAWSNMNARLARSTSNPAAIGPSDFTAQMINESSNEVTVSAEALGARAKDLLARAALDMIGVDPAAEQFWLAAINDPNLPSEERHELIESLSEAGFTDAGHVTTDDLPLIASRIALIEELAPGALDSVNAAAFQDAYRDLLNMFGSIITTERAAEPEVTDISGTGE